MSNDEEALFDLLEQKFGFSLRPIIRRCTIADALNVNSYTIAYPDGTERDEVECVAAIIPQIGDAVKVENLDGSPTITHTIGHGPIREQDGTATQATTASATYITSGAASDVITVEMVAGQTVAVTVSSRTWHSLGVGHAAILSFKVTGADTYGPNDDDGTEHDDSASNTCSRMTLYTAVTTGTHTFTLTYRAVNGASGNWINRRISVVE